MQVEHMENLAAPVASLDIAAPGYITCVRGHMLRLCALAELAARACVSRLRFVLHCAP